MGRCMGIGGGVTRAAVIGRLPWVGTGLAGDGAALFVDRANNRGGGFGINELRLEIMNMIGVSGSPWQNMWVAML